MPSYVFIWEQNMYRNKRVKGHDWPGHSSLNIGDQFDKPAPGIQPGRVDEYADDVRNHQAGLRHNYVSWWPTELTGGFGPKALFTKRKAGMVRLSIAEDVRVETYLPDHVIELSTSTGTEQAMQAEWNAIRNKNKASYGAFRKNCSTIVSRVLHAGGFYGLRWAENNNWAWAPSDIRRLALAAGGTAIRWDDLEANQLANSGLDPADWSNIDYARSGAYCTSGVPVAYQQAGYSAG